jgi:hypothetical protein
MFPKNMIKTMLPGSRHFRGAQVLIKFTHFLCRCFAHLDLIIVLV